MRLPIPGGRMQPLGRRIVELPEDPLALVYRDSHSGFIAYVPYGSISAGRSLVASAGASGLPPCATCHGATLNGSAAGPPLAGRPPSYLVRQLWAFESGERNPAAAAAMHLVAAPLTADQMLCMAAYLASRPPE
jgi:cytochrome c553